MNDKGRAEVTEIIKDLLAEGETALYDSVAQAFDHLQTNPAPDRISAVIVLTDGEDNRSKSKIDELLKTVRFDPEKNPTRIFTIAYGKQANKTVLKNIAEATHAKSYEGDPRTIRVVFKDVATFF
jgi:Ca-activated chloride channel family protein